MGWIGEALSDSTNVFEELGHVIKFARVRVNLVKILGKSSHSYNMLWLNLKYKILQNSVKFKNLYK